MRSFHVLVVVLLSAEAQTLPRDPVRLPAINPGRICPANQDTIRQNISAALLDRAIFSCGGTPGWRRIGNLDMTDPSQSCPTGLALKTYSAGLRACGRVTDAAQTCFSTLYETSGSEYSQVCGRIKAYQFGSGSAFYGHTTGSQNLDGWYVEGLSLTHGQVGSRTHIWSFAAGLSAIYGGSHLDQFCQCAQTNAPSPPSFVGNDYFCESGNKSPGHAQFIFYPDPLWDGQNCAGAANTCCQLNGPPYFTKTLPTATTDDVELRLCVEDRGIHSDVPIEQVELYIK